MTEQEPPAPDEPIAPPPRRGRKRRLTSAIWVVATNIIILLFATYLFLSLTDRALTAPGWLADRVRDEVNKATKDAHFDIGRLGLAVGDAGLPEAQITNLLISDARGVEVARLNRADVRFAPEPMLRGELLPRNVAISGAQAILRRRTDGAFDISFGSGQLTSGAYPDLIDQLDGLMAEPFMRYVERLSISDLTISIEDARTGRVWQITDGRMSLVRAEKGLDLSVDFELFNGTEELATISIALSTSQADSSAQLRALFENATASDIALQSPVLSFLGVLDAPISGGLQSSLDAEGILQSLAGELEIGKGALQPTASSEPIRFDVAGTAFHYEPYASKIIFDDLRVESASLGLEAQGHAYLDDFDGAWPQELLGQFQLASLETNPRGQLDRALRFTGGAADMRLRLAPFAIEFGQVALKTDAERLSGKGQVRADDQGWHVEADLHLDQITAEDFLGLWPQAVLPRTRVWLDKNILSGVMRDVRVSLRDEPQQDRVVDVGFAYDGLVMQVLKDFPQIQNAAGFAAVQGNRVVLAVEEGYLPAPMGPPVDLAGSSFVIEDASLREAHADIKLTIDAPARSVLSVLALPPINALRGSDFAPDFVAGLVKGEVDIRHPIKAGLKGSDFRYQAEGQVIEAQSDRLVKGKVLTSPNLTINVDNSGIEVRGPVTIGAVSGRGGWTKKFGPEHAGKSKVKATVPLSAALVSEFNLGLPKGWVTGKGQAALTLDFQAGQPPAYVFESDLRGAKLSLPEIGWSKGKDTSGNLTVSGRLGARPTVDLLNLSAPGLTLADGRVTLREAGGLASARFGQVSVESWLTAPVSIIGRGPGVPPRIELEGGTLDMTRMKLGTSGQNGGPISVNLSSLQVTRGIRLTGVAGQLDGSGGLTGQLSGRVNGGTGVSVALSRHPNGTAFTVRGKDGGRILGDAGIFPGARGGDLTLQMVPLGGAGRYQGVMNMGTTRVIKAPVLTELLNALSIIGLLDQLSGSGIVFTEVIAVFYTSPDAVRVNRASAVGPSMGVAIDGVYDLKRSRMDMQGVISPVYFLNAIGQLVSSRRGEGLFGFNFRLQGASTGPSVQVNPLSILTPGVFRDIFRAPPPQVNQ